MSHRLQHLARRRTDSTDPILAKEEANTIMNGSEPASASIKKSEAASSSVNTRPIFAPTNTVHPYSKNDYKKGQVAFPPPESLYQARDTEVDPCFLRTSTVALNTLPRKSSLPIAAWITPFANNKVSVVDVRAPLRCSACKAYVNPYFQFDGTRRAATCNLCGLRFPVEQTVDKTNLTSAEVATQSIIDFRVTDKIYFKKRTDIIKVIAVVELTMDSLTLGVFSTVISSLSSAFESHEFEERVRVSIAFYSDQGIGYLQKGEEGKPPTIFLVPNNKNNISCCPLSEQQMMFHPNAEREELLNTLKFLEEYGENCLRRGRFTHTANYIQAIRSIKECFEQQTGKVLLFSCLGPRQGSAVIRGRNEEEEKLPLKPLHLDIYELGRQLVRLRVGVEHFFFSKDHLISHELATTHFLSSITGGELHLDTAFNSSRSSFLYYRIFHAITRPTYFDCDFTCRASPGLSVVRYGVPEGLRQGRDIAISMLSSASSFLVELEQQQKLEQFKGAYIQFALLYTNGKGERRIRVVNFRFDVTPSLQAVFESIDYLTFTNSIARTYSMRVLKSEPGKAREEAIGYLSQVISQFHTRCRNALCARIQGLIVPQGLAWALYYLHSILNSKLFLNEKSTSDARICQFLQLHSDTPYSFASRTYPRLYPLTLDIYDAEPLPGDFLDENEEERIAVLPWTLPLRKESLKEAGVYLYDARDELIILVQSQASEEVLLELFGSTNWEQLQAEGLPELETSHNIRVNNIVGEIRRRSTELGGMYQQVIVKPPLKKKRYADLMSSILKQECPECPFGRFVELIKARVSSSK